MGKKLWTIGYVFVLLDKLVKLVLSRRKIIQKCIFWSFKIGRKIIAKWLIYITRLLNLPKQCVCRISVALLPWRRLKNEYSCFNDCIRFAYSCRKFTKHFKYVLFHDVYDVKKFGIIILNFCTKHLPLPEVGM